MIWYLRILQTITAISLADLRHLFHFCLYSYDIFCLADMECADVPLLTPSSKEMMSQALKATFSGFSKEQQRLGIPKGRFCSWKERGWTRLWDIVGFLTCWWRLTYSPPSISSHRLGQTSVGTSVDTCWCSLIFQACPCHLGLRAVVPKLVRTLNSGSSENSTVQARSQTN